MKFRVLFFFLVNSIICTAQIKFEPGFIVTNEGDSIIGFIGFNENSSNYQKCFFRESIDAATEELNADQIKKYSVQGKRVFESREIADIDQNMERVFLDVLIEGKLSLFSYRSRLFVEKEKIKLYELTNTKKMVSVEGRTGSIYSNEYIGVLSSQTADCSTSNKDLDKVKFNLNNVSTFIIKYNQCLGGEFFVYGKELLTKNRAFGLVIGYSATSIIRNFGRDYTDEAITYGLQFESSTPRISPRFSYIIGIHYQRFQFNDIGINISFSQIKLPIAIKYTLNMKLVSPYISIGPVGTLNFDSNWEEGQGAGMRSLNITDGSIGYHLSLGLKTRISPNLIGELRYRYETSRFQSTSAGTTDFRTKNNQFLVGINYVLK